jgi:hypothetical protein
MFKNSNANSEILFIDKKRKRKEFGTYKGEHRIP